MNKFFKRTDQFTVNKQCAKRFLSFNFSLSSTPIFYYTVKQYRPTRAPRDTNDVGTLFRSFFPVFFSGFAIAAEERCAREGANVKRD